VSTCLTDSIRQEKVRPYAAVNHSTYRQILHTELANERDCSAPDERDWVLQLGSGRAQDSDGTPVADLEHSAVLEDGDLDHQAHEDTQDCPSFGLLGEGLQ